ncbi:MAG TPA: multidrug efflux SMR transporter [Rhodanobacteraceae bacterium]
MGAWALLALAIVSEVIGTTALKLSAGFTRLGPSVVVVAGYAAAFYFLALTLKHLSIGTAYAVWSGAGTVLITLIGVFAFRQKIDAAGIIGIALIVAGVLVLNLASRGGVH